MTANEGIKDEIVERQFAILQKDMIAIREALEANIGADGFTASDFERIKIPAGGGTAWSVPGPEGEETVKEITGVIIRWRDTRAYWSVPMEQSNGSAPPDCFSADGHTGVGRPGGICSQCSLSKFGSNAKSGGQACKSSRELFFIREDSYVPDIVALPPSSIAAARAYLKRLTAKGVPCDAVVTRLSLERTKNSRGFDFSMVSLASGRRLTREEAQRAREYGKMIGSFLKSTPIPMAVQAGEPEGEVI